MPELNFSSPIFIVGCTNTGTKVLQSAIAKTMPVNNFPIEPHYLGFAPNLEGRINRLFALHPCFKSTRLHPKTFPGSIESGPLSRELFTRHTNLYAERFAPQMFSDPFITCQTLFKEPKFILRIPWLLDLFPDAKIIITVRNPWSTVEGIQRRLHSFGDTPFKCCIPTCAAQYLTCYTYSSLDISQYPPEKSQSTFFHVRYEDLCTDPNASLKSISEFLDLDFTSLSTFDASKFDKSLITSSFNSLKKEDIQFIDAYTKQIQNVFAYSISYSGDSKINFSF